jgi:hypothetical protein
VLLAVNFRRQRVTEAEHDLAVERGTREEVQSFNERFGTAAEQLAHDNAAVRMAGVYAMAGLADDWTDKRQVCVDVLCGYFRMSPETDGDPGEGEVREAILRVIRERVDEGYRGGLWRNVNFDFTGVEFEDADFIRLRFGGTVTFDGAQFTGELTSFTGTVFDGALSCHGTTFAAKRTTFAAASFARQAEFVGAEFTSGQVDFSGLQVSGMAVDFYRSTFTAGRLDFSRSTVRSGSLRFAGCDFSDTELYLSFINEYSGFGRLMIEGCRFTGGSIELEMFDVPTWFFWLVGTRFEAVEFKVITDQRVPWLNVRDEVLVDTLLPAKHVRR